MFKKLCLTFLFSFSVLPVYSELSTEDLNAIKSMVVESETRLKEYIDIKFANVDQRFQLVEKQIQTVEKQIDSVDKRVAHSSNVTYGLIALIVVAVGIPQIIVIVQNRRN